MHTAKDKAAPKNAQAVAAPVYRSIPEGPAPAAEPGSLGAEVVKAATLHQLDRYANEIEQYVNASNMGALLNRIQGELKKDQPAQGPRMRLRRD